MVIKNKIEAIKAVWDHASMKPEIFTDHTNGRQYIDWKKPGLKDSKDLVEAIMRLAVQEFLSDSKTFNFSNGDPLAKV